MSINPDESGGTPAGTIKARISCNRCSYEAEYSIACHNWPHNLECRSCERNGHLEVAGDGTVEFEGINLTDFDLGDFEQVTYRPEDSGFDPPDKHYKVGENQYRAETGDVSMLNESTELVSAIHTPARDDYLKKTLGTPWL